MAVARRSEKRATKQVTEDEMSAERDAELQGHEAAIERLREIAENGLDAPDLDGLENIAAETDDRSGNLGVDRAHLRVVEAMIFASPQPVSERKLVEQLPEDVDVEALLDQLQSEYETRGVHLVCVAKKWTFRTADDLSYLLEKHAVEERRLSKAALETLSIIAYHQPVTRSEIEEIRGVQTSRGTLDVLMETNWVRPRGRRRAPGKPLTYGTTDEFLSHFGLEALGDLPGLSDLKSAGLLDSDLPPDFAVPSPKEVAAQISDELPLEEDEDADELPIDDDVDVGPDEDDNDHTANRKGDAD